MSVNIIKPTCERLVNGDWHACPMSALNKGDTFRLIGPDGNLVGGKNCIAASEPYEMDFHGEITWGIDVKGEDEDE